MLVLIFAQNLTLTRRRLDFYILCKQPPTFFAIDAGIVLAGELPVLPNLLAMGRAEERLGIHNRGPPVTMVRE